MALPSEITALTDHLNQELDQTEQKAIEGLNIVRPALSRFPDNAILIQFFAYLNNVVLFVETYKRQSQNTIERISANDVTAAEIQEAGEDLGTILGRVLETKIGIRRIITRFFELAMKQLPDEKELLELLEMARIVEQQARETSELATEIAYKWQRRLETRIAAK